MSPVSETVLEVTGLAAGYGGQAVVQDINFEVPQGHVLTVLGPNGSGKSTLVKALVGELVPLSGNVRAFGRTVTGFTIEKLAKLGFGYVPQLNDTFRTLSVLENLELGGFGFGKKRIAAGIESACALFPALKAMLHRRVDVLSGGERKMVGLARALMADPKLLFLDEPTAGLAPEIGKRVLNDAVRMATTSGVGVVLVEQRANDALEVADRALVLVGGNIVFEGLASALWDEEDVASLFLRQR